MYVFLQKVAARITTAFVSGFFRLSEHHGNYPWELVRVLLKPSGFCSEDHQGYNSCWRNAWCPRILRQHPTAQENTPIASDHKLRVGCCVVDPELGYIDGPDGRIRIELKAMEVLTLLCQRPGGTVFQRGDY